FSVDTSFEQLEPAHQRAILHGTGDAWIPLESEEQAQASGGRKPPGSRSKTKKAASSVPALRFQYKGLFPAIDEASRVSFASRQKGAPRRTEVAGPPGGGSRLGGEAAACRFADSPLGRWGELPLGQTLALFKTLNLPKDQPQVAGELLREITNRLQFLV